MRGVTDRGWPFAMWGLAAALILLQAGCSEPRLEPLPEGAVVLAFGDSLTSGSGASAEKSYPARLELLIGRRVVNAGVPGELSAQGLERLPKALEEHRPALVILCHGGNDFLQKRDPAETRRNVSRMLRLAKESGAQAVLIGVPPLGLFLRKTAPLYDEAAREAGVPFEGRVLPGILKDGSLKSDYVHPNEKGYQRLAEAVAGLLRRRGAV